MSPDIQDAAVQLFIAVMGLLVVIITTFVVPWVRAHASATQLAFARMIAVEVVTAVEQVTGGAGGNDALRRARAIEWAKSLGATKGIRLSDEQWGVLIEAAVKSMKASVDNVVTPAVVLTE